jgi:hypothetical protein
LGEWLSVNPPENISGRKNHSSAPASQAGHQGPKKISLYSDFVLQSLGVVIESSPWGIKTTFCFSLLASKD